MGRPAGRAVCRAQPMAVNFFHPPHPHPHTDHPIDFMNPDCHLLRKKRSCSGLRQAELRCHDGQRHARGPEDEPAEPLHALHATIELVLAEDVEGPRKFNTSCFEGGDILEFWPRCTPIQFIKN